MAMPLPPPAFVFELNELDGTPPPGGTSLTWMFANGAAAMRFALRPVRLPVAFTRGPSVTLPYTRKPASGAFSASTSTMAGATAGTVGSTFVVTTPLPVAMAPATRTVTFSSLASLSIATAQKVATAASGEGGAVAACRNPHGRHPAGIGRVVIGRQRHTRAKDDGLRLDVVRSGVVALDVDRSTRDGRRARRDWSPRESF